MSVDRRGFLRAVGAASGAALSVDVTRLSALEAAARDTGMRSAVDLASDERFWFTVQQAYRQSSGFINLESGWFSPAPTEVLEAHIDHLSSLNRVTSFYLRQETLWPAEMAELKHVIGQFCGLAPDQFVITRNTTESLNVVIQGLQLAAGDEIVYGTREYPSMIDALQQRAERFGTTLKTIDVPMVPRDEREVVSVYEEAIGPRTKALLVSHMVFLTGQILPVRAICDMAHAHGVEVIVDAAHSFAHIDYRIPDLGCDYLGTSLHKWLGVPIGTGLLYVKKDKISKVWPLMGDRQFPKDDIRKFEHIGTHPVFTDLTIRDAIRFHEAIGGRNKEARLRYLKNYWVKQVVDLPKVRINTPSGDRDSCAIANIAIDGRTPAQVAAHLFESRRVFTVAVEMGVRVSPNLFTTLQDLDVLVAGVRDLTAMQ